MELPDLPELLEHCFEWFKEIHKERSEGFSPNPLTSEFIVRRMALYDIVLFDIELKAIRLIDEAYLEIMNGRHS